ncbi:MAG: glycosyltransferase family 4 protein [Candidatus Thermoplasmatota archaeon]|nr:glycosyltransferase family 4 protein [Candidatus Thermoplasmatota archaeon]MBS3790062.1 glycosyltransferase family 4 protein [Candidatus Thermoplasmatota archaeon]
MKDKIRLLFIMGIFYPLMGGPTVALDTILPYLVKNKKIEKVFVLTTYVRGEELIDEKRYNERQIKVLRLLIPRSNIFEGKNILQKPFQGFRVLYNGLMIFFVCTYFSINIVHDIFRYDYIITRFLNTPSIMDIRSLDREEPRFKPDFVIAISKKIYNMHKKWAGDSIENVPIPLSSVSIGKKEEGHVLKEHNLKDRRYICFVGRMTIEKGVDLLLSSFEKLREEMPDMHLVLIGGREGGTVVDGLNHQCKKEKVHCLGELGHRETLAVMKNSELVALPSRKEGMGRVMLEALQLNKKVLAPNCVDEFSEQIPDFVLKEYEPETIKDQMKRIINEEKKPDYDLEPHEPKKVVRMWIKTYEELLKGRHSA